jgi:hypothetical protein
VRRRRTTRWGRRLRRTACCAFLPALPAELAPRPRTARAATSPVAAGGGAIEHNPLVPWPEGATALGAILFRYRQPIPLLTHLDVVEAFPADWSCYYYGRGTADDKFMAATSVANLVVIGPTATLSWRWRRTRRSATAMRLASDQVAHQQPRVVLVRMGSEKRREAHPVKGGT